MTVATSLAQVVAGEAVSGTPEQRYEDMKAIASVIANRAAMLGVSMDDVVSAPGQFDAFGKPMPPGTSALVGMAQQALDDVQQNGVTTNATYYATPAAANNLPPGLQPETQTKGHIYYSDPQFRSIITAQGIVTPDPNALPGVQVPGAAIPEARLTTTTPDLSKTGLLGALFASDPNAPSLNNSFAPVAAATPISSPLGVTATGSLGTPNLAASAVASPMTNSGWNTMAAAGPMGGYPADPMSADRMGNPAVNSFQPMAFAGPIQSPLGVTATADQPTSPGLTAQASVPGLLAGPVSTPSLNNWSDLAAAGPISSPSVPNAASIAAGATDVGSGLGTPATVSQRMGMPVSDWSTMAAATPISSPLSSVTASAPSATSAALAAQATATPSVATVQPSTTGLLSGYQATPTATPGEMAINGLLSQPSAPTSFDMGRFAPTIDPATNTQSFYDSNWTSPAAVASYNAMSNLDTSSIATPTDLGTESPGYRDLVAATFPDSVTTATPTDTTTTSTPSVNSTVPGPATTPAQVQSAYTGQVTATPSTAPKSALSGIFNGPTLAGGLLGALAGGPVGGLLGGLIGNRINASGGMTGLLGGHPMSINNIGGGLANVASVYGGATAGTQANTNNGGRVTSLGNGFTAYTNPFGVTTVEGPNQFHASYFGPSLTDHTNNSGPSGGPGVSGAAY